jgi:hypothetical protein
MGKAQIVPKTRLETDSLLLLSLLSVILLNPLLDRDDLGKLFLTALIFVPVILATIRLSETKRWIRPSILLMSMALISGIISVLVPNHILLAIKWASLSLFFGLTVIGLFSYIRSVRSVTRPHLISAVSIYLLLGMMWFALYSAIDAAFPGSFQYTNNVIANRQSELLYFSLVTLTTIGYGDIVPLNGEARMLAALEGVVGVLYVAITVAILVSAFRRQPSSHEE